MGANGKGITREYFKYFHEKNGFYHFPDECLMTADEYLAVPNPYVHKWLELVGIPPELHHDFHGI